MLLTLIAFIALLGTAYLGLATFLTYYQFHKPTRKAPRKRPVPKTPRKHPDKDYPGEELK